MRLQHVAEQIYAQPWLITASGHHSVRSLFEGKLARLRADDSAEDEFSSPFIVQGDGCLRSEEGGVNFFPYERYKETNSNVSIFTPENIASLLKKADASVRP